MALMDGGNVIYAAERFIERGKRAGEQTPDVDNNVVYLDAYRKEHDEAIEAIVEQSATRIAVILESNGYKEEGDQVLERARQFARTGTPAYEIYEIFNQYLKDAHPGLHRVYRL